MYNSGNLSIVMERVHFYNENIIIGLPEWGREKEVFCMEKKKYDYTNQNGMTEDDKTCGITDMNCVEEEDDKTCGLNNMNCLEEEDDKTCGLNNMNCEEDN